MANVFKLFNDIANKHIDECNNVLKYTKKTVKRNKQLKLLKYWNDIEKQSRNK